MTKIAMIGADSTVFVKNILGDLFLSEGLGVLGITLMDIDPIRLATSGKVASKICNLGRKPCAHTHNYGS